MSEGHEWNTGGALVATPRTALDEALNELATESEPDSDLESDQDSFGPLNYQQL